MQERIATLHAFSAPDPTLPDDVVVVVPLKVGDPPVALDSILTTLSGHAVKRVILPIRGPAERVREVMHEIQEAPVPIHPIWCNHPDVESLLAKEGIRGSGKGLDVWLGLAVASELGKYIVVHDADNTTYTDSHVPRLAWPLQSGCKFVKAYYARVESNQLYGRLTRLMALPLIEAARRETKDDLYEYLGAFRYPLAGEFALDSTIAQSLRVPVGWGLELGLLMEGFRLTGFSQSGQVDLGWHQHDHRSVDGPEGLAAMATAVADTFYTGVVEQSSELDKQVLEEQYRSVALEMLEGYALDAAFNGLTFDRVSETRQIDAYANAIVNASITDRLPAFDSTGLDAQSLLEFCCYELI